MARHMVKCSICGEQFDANIIPFEKTHNGHRYAHVECFNHQEELKTQEQKDRERLEEYIKKLFNIEKLNPRLYKTLKQYIDEYNYSYSGILKALTYFYEVKGNDVSKANGGIGIVPYCYQDAYNYYYSLWVARQKNNEKVIHNYEPEILEIVIPSPERKVFKRKLFSFLDEE